MGIGRRGRGLVCINDRDAGLHGRVDRETWGKDTASEVSTLASWSWGGEYLGAVRMNNGLIKREGMAQFQLLGALLRSLVLLSHYSHS